MPEKSGWVPTRDLAALIESCERWNKDRFFEILWEYNRLTPSILKDRKARGWFYYEDGSLEGFALGRERLGWWHFEELWGPCEGSSELPSRIKPVDEVRAGRFRKLLAQLKTRTLIRAAVDNSYANIIAQHVGAQWSGGFLLATRILQRKLAVDIPGGFELRRFRNGDEKFMSRIQLAAFRFPHPPGEYRKWATRSNCLATLAVLQGEPVGFLIAEKRRYGGYGDFIIAVDPQHHRRGVGSALMQNGLNDLIDMECTTVVADFLLQNAGVQALNRKHGFNIVRAYNYYRTGVLTRRVNPVQG